MVFLPSLGLALGPPELDISSLPIPISLLAEAHLKLDKHLFSWKPERGGNCLQARGGGGRVEYRQAVSENSFTQPFIHGFFFFLFEKETHYDCVVLASLELAFLFLKQSKLVFNNEESFQVQ